MGNFGDAVASLLDTYARCLSLLGDFTKSRKDEGEQQTAKRRKRSSSKSSSVVSASAAPNAVPANVLRRAIQNARAKVLRSYSSKLQRRGQSFERGDGESA
jgi:hypothetical protein